MKRHNKIKPNPRMMSDLIWTKKNSLSKDFCKHVIDKFEKDPNPSEGRIGSDCRIDLNIKKSTDITISPRPEWKEEDDVFCNSLSIGIQEYKKHCMQLNGHGFYHPIQDFNDSGYQIQRTRPGEFYDWHHDFIVENNGPRVGTFIWYLNDIKKDGYTEFIDGTKIKPRTGKLVIFPASWEYIHRGYPPKSETKYICTGWLFPQ